MIIDNEYEIGETVYLKTDTDQLPHIIVAFKIFGKGEIFYVTNQAAYESIHFGFELTKEKVTF